MEYAKKILLLITAWTILITMLIPTASAAFNYIDTINGTGDENEHPNKIFSSPISVAVGDRFYAADSGENLVYTMEGNSKDRTIGAGTLPDVTNIIYMNGSLYIFSSHEGEIYVYRHSSNLDNFAGRLHFYQEPMSIAYYNNTYYVLGREGKIYIHDQNENYITSILRKGTCVDCMDEPYDMGMYEGKFYISEPKGNIINVFDLNGSFNSNIGGSTLKGPHGLFIGNDRLFVADTNNKRIAVFSGNGKLIETYRGEENRTFEEPYDVWVNGSYVYVADTGMPGIVVLKYSDEITGSGKDVIQHANESVTKLENLMQGAGKINITWDSDVPARYDEAIAKVQANDISYLPVLNETANDADEEYDILCAKVTKYSNGFIGDAQDILKGYRSYMDLSDIDKLLAQLRIDVDENRCDNQADAVVEIKEDMEGLVGNAPAVSVSKNISNRLSSIELRIAALKEKNGEYSQKLNISQLEIWTNIIESKMQAGDSAGAADELSQMESTVSQWEDYLDTKIGDIAEALALINETESKMQNTTDNADKIAHAKLIVYDDPQSAIAICGTVKSETGVSRDIIIIISAAVIVSIIVFALIYTSRKKWK